MTVHLSLVPTSLTSGLDGSARLLDLDPAFEALLALTDDVRSLSDPYFGPFSATPVDGQTDLGPLINAVSRVVVNDDSVIGSGHAHIQQALHDNPGHTTLEPAELTWEAEAPECANDLLAALDPVDANYLVNDALEVHADPVLYVNSTDTPEFSTSILDDLGVSELAPDDADLTALAWFDQPRKVATAEHAAISVDIDTSPLFGLDTHHDRPTLSCVDSDPYTLFDSLFHSL